LYVTSHPPRSHGSAALAADGPDGIYPERKFTLRNDAGAQNTSIRVLAFFSAWRRIESCIFAERRDIEAESPRWQFYAQSH
jgi:hypothetical protein